MLDKIWPRLLYSIIASVILTHAYPSKAHAAAMTCSEIFQNETKKQNDKNSVLNRVLELFSNSEIPWHNRSADEKISQIVRDKTEFPVKMWTKDQIQTTSSSDNFVFVEANTSSFKADLKADEQVFRDHMLSPFFKNPIKFLFSGERQRSISETLKLKWAFHNSVIQTYANHPHKKKYLSKFGLSELIWQNSLHETHDVFAVLRPSNKKIQDLTAKEISESVIVTAQLTYASQKNQVSFSNPQPFDFLMQYKSAMDNREDLWLPFIDRLSIPTGNTSNSTGKLIHHTPTVDIRAFIEKLKSDFTGLKLAEINRLAKPMNDQPDVLRDYLLLKLLQRAEEKGVGILFASTDRATKRLFSREYFFSEYSTIERPIYEDGTLTGDLSETEYLLYIKVGSPEYLQLIAKLKNSVDQQIQSTKKSYLD